MDRYDLERQIKLILSQAGQHQTFYTADGLRGFSFLLSKHGAAKSPSLAPQGELKLVNEPVLLLRRLYASCPPDLQSVFPAMLLGGGNIAPDSARVVTHVVLDIGALSWLREMINGPTHLFAWHAVSESLLERLQNEQQTVTASDLDEVEWLASALVRVGYAVTQLGIKKRRARITTEDVQLGDTLRKSAENLEKIVTLVRYQRLKVEILDAQNAEINADERVLLGRIESLGFGRDLQETLYEIERKSQGAVTAADFKSCMDFCRSFLEEFLERAAKRSESRATKPIPATAAKSHFQPWRQYLTNVGVLTDDESELLQKLYNYVSNAGSHALGANAEHARVTKNLVIELTMMIAGRVRQLVASAT